MKSSIIVLKIGAMDTKLIDETINGLTRAPRQLREIALESGVSESWLSKFKRGVYPDPSARRVVRVYQSLISRGLVSPELNLGVDTEEVA